MPASSVGRVVVPFGDVSIVWTMSSFPPGMSVELLLIRHGESAANVGLSTEPDCSLTEHGLEQTRHVAQRLLALNLAGFTGLVSPYCRAQQTAAEITRLTGLPFTIDDNIREWASAATINGRHYPAETGQELIDRLRAFLRQYDGRQLIAISHAAPIAFLTQLAWNELPITEGPFWTGVPNGCLRWLKMTAGCRQ